MDNIRLEIEKILDDWDPIGILQEFKPIQYFENAIGEYTSYITPILITYLQKKPVYDYLYNLQTEIMHIPNSLELTAIEIAAKKITKFLSGFSKEDIRRNAI
jgi:hypothetical protein